MERFLNDMICNYMILVDQDYLKIQGEMWEIRDFDLANMLLLLCTTWNELEADMNGRNELRLVCIGMQHNTRICHLHCKH